jgi:hypothetical protein
LQFVTDTTHFELVAQASSPQQVADLLTSYTNPVPDYSLVDFTPKFDQKINLSGLNIYYDRELECGGPFQHEFFKQLLRNNFSNRKFNNCLEWCSGPGFIGYSLLGSRLVSNLVLADIYKPALDCCEYTRNKIAGPLKERISTRHISSVSQLPDSDKFDLVVGNPPWFDSFSTIPSRNRVETDKEWQTHRDFFKNIKQHLAEDGVIILCEALSGSNALTFNDMIRDSGLEISMVFTTRSELSQVLEVYWFMVVTHSKGV